MGFNQLVSIRKFRDGCHIGNQLPPLLTQKNSGGVTFDLNKTGCRTCFDHSVHL